MPHLKSFNSQAVRRLGTLLEVKENHDALTGWTTHGNFKLEFLSDYVVRIAVSLQSEFDSFSYSVIEKPRPGIYQHSDQGSKIIIRTQALQIEISKDPVTFQFFDSSGNLLNEDEPGLGISWIGEQVTAYKKLQEGERFIGLGEKTGPLDRRGHGYQNWNTDAFAYHSGTDPLYSSIPFYIGLHSGRTYGIFLDNSQKSFFNFGASNNRFSSFAIDCGELNYYFIAGNSVAEIIGNYTWLTGRMSLPPRWSLGYQQCRYSYYPDKEVLNVAKTFRDKNIPADALVLDIHYMDKYKIFTWDNKNFSDPKGLIAQLNQWGFHVVLMCDPGIKSEDGYPPFEDGKAKDVFLKYPDGEYYSGQVWPGWCHFPDFTNPSARAWWAEWIKEYAQLGVEGYWNDMNEIATWGHMLPENLVFDFDGGKTTSRRGRNVYGFQMARSTFEGAKKSLKGIRPFNLTRSGFAGIQRFAAVWTGDNVSYDDHMMLGVRLVNSMGISGVAFAGYDVGGFAGEASNKLFARWISIAAFSPFFRGHTMINTRDSEPWSFGEEVEQIARNYIRMRYQLLPYIYSLFYEASQTGMPVQRSLAISHSHLKQVYEGQFQHEYLFGPSILVTPVESNKDFAKVFLPEGQWYYLFNGNKLNGNQELIIDSPVNKLPLFIQAGAIIPMQPPSSYSDQDQQELNIHLYWGKENSSFEFYWDDGRTYDYEKGVFCKRAFRFFPNERKLIIGKAEGTFKPSFEKIKIILHGFDKLNKTKINQSAATIARIQHHFFLPLEKFDPIVDPDSMGEEEVQVVETDYTASQIEFVW